MHPRYIHFLRALAYSALLSLCACGGGGSSAASAPPSEPPSSFTDPNGGTSAQLVIGFPSIGSTAALRRPRFASPGAVSLAVRINGAAVQTYDVSTTSANCAPTNDGRACVLVLAAAAGSDSFAIELYDAPGGSGHLLGKGTATAPLVAGQRTPLHVTFNGIPAAVRTSYDNANPPVGAASTTVVHVAALDAAGAQIIGDDYATPISLTNSDTSGATRLSTTTVSNPATVVTLAYDGRLLPAQTIGALGLASQDSQQFYPDALTEFTVPQGATGLAAGPDGNVWFTSGPSTGPFFVGKITSTGTITAYPVPRRAIVIAAGADGNVWIAEDGLFARMTPMGSYTEFPFARDGENFNSMASGPDGKMWFTQSSGLGNIAMDGTMTVLSKNGGDEYITAGPDGAMWFSTFLGNTIGRVATDGTISSFPIVPSDPVNAGLPYNAQRGSMAFGADGWLYFGKSFGYTDRMRVNGTMNDLVQHVQGTDYVRTLDGNVWMATPIGRITPDGVITAFPIAPNHPLSYYSKSLVAGSDGNLWFLGANNTIDRFRLR